MIRYVFIALLYGVISYGQTSTSAPFFRAPDNLKLVSADLHIHTVFSDGSVWPNIRVEEARREGLDLISLTEHLEYQPHEEDIPHPNRNRSYEIALNSLREGEKLQVIHGSEITRSMPPGHINAVFITDANALLFPNDSLAGIQAANAQKAFVFWNHPNWDAHRSNGIARLEPFHEYLIKNKLLHGIEVVNETTFSEEAFQIALDHDLTLIGTSDIHGLTTWNHNIPQGGHRPMTFVLSESTQPNAIKQALFEGKTVIWFENLLIGKPAHIEAVIKANVQVEKAYYKKDKEILMVTLTNTSALPMELQYKGAYSLHFNSDWVHLPAYSSKEIAIKTVEKRKRVDLPFEILNAVIGPKKHSQISWQVTP